MQALTISREPAMGSREIADLVESRHDNVRVTIERLADRGVIQLPALQEVRNHLGQRVTEYLVGKRDSYVVVAQLSPEFTARLVDRWQELEQQVVEQRPQLPDFTNPVKAARAWANEVEQKLEAEAALQKMRPAVEFVERYVDAGATKSLREVAKVLGLPERRFVSDLINDGVLYRQSGNLLPRQRHHHAKRFEVKTGERNGHAYIQTRVTTTGIEWLAKQYSHAIGDGDTGPQGDLL